MCAHLASPHHKYVGCQNFPHIMAHSIMYVFQHPTYLSCVYASRLSKPQECRLSEFPRYVGCQNFPHIIAHRIMFLFQHPIYPSCVCASRLSSPRVCRMSEFLHIRWREISEFADFSFFRGIQEIYNGAQELAHPSAYGVAAVSRID